MLPATNYILIFNFKTSSVHIDGREQKCGNQLSDKRKSNNILKLNEHFRKCYSSLEANVTVRCVIFL